MRLDIDQIFGIWELTGWTSKLLDSETEDIYADERKNIISTVKVWETEEWYSNFYSGLFKRNFKSVEQLLNYKLHFKRETDHRGHYEVELIEIESNQSIKKFWWKLIEDEEWPQNSNMEISLLDYTTYGNLIITNDELQLTDITDGLRIDGTVNFEYAVHQMNMTRINDDRKKIPINQSNKEIKPKEKIGWLKSIFK